MIKNANEGVVEYDNFTIDYINRQIHTKLPITPREMYSDLKSIFDEWGQMDDPIPVVAVPTQYKIKVINGWNIYGLDQEQKFDI